MNTTAPDPKTEPILNDPWAVPEAHWKDAAGTADPVYTFGRRPSQQNPRVSEWLGLGLYSHEEAQPYVTINGIREQVSAWRGTGYPGAGIAGKRLLTRWRDSAAEQSDEIRPFFCQREAVETLAWLLCGPRADPNAREHWRKVRRGLEAINDEWNDGLPRMAVKMATGAGKTLTMAMTIAFLETLHPAGCRVVVISPNLTVHDRLAELPELVESVAGRRRDRSRAQIVRCNFQKFRRNNETWSGLGGTPSTLTKQLLRAEEQEESEAAMLDRLLEPDPEGLPLYVFQDEGHHCRRDTAAGRKTRAKSSAKKKDEDEDELDPEGQWYGAVRAIAEHRDLKAIFDFSATPAYLTKPTQLATPIFPWTISDYPVEDAMEAGICKIPRVPVAPDDEGEADRRLTHVYQVCRDENRKDPWGEHPPPEVVDLMKTLAANWEEKRRPYQKLERTPAVIVVVNSVKNARTLYRYLAGRRATEDDVGASPGNWIPGAIPAFSNIHPTSGKPREQLPTLLVHSRIGESGEEGVGQDAESKAVADEQLELRTPNKTRPEALAQIRDIFQSVGEPGKPGEHIRCVISVAMLSEGWDAKTVTHVLGYRKFGSVLLCEQVIGRALRRPSLDDPKTPDYAEVFGVPFPGLRNFAPPRNEKDPPAPYEVRSVPGRDRYRLVWPFIERVDTVPAEGARYRLDPSRVRKWQPDLEAPMRATVKGPVGEREKMEPEYRREQTALYRLASALADHWKNAATHEANESEAEAFRRNGLLFVDALRAIYEWLAHRKVVVPWPFRLGEEGWLRLAVEELAFASISEAGKPARLVPVFENDLTRSRPRTGNTAGFRFNTTLPNRYPNCQKSELSDAACHSAPEAEIAALLDRVSAVRSWVRIFRMDWRIPWWDPASLSWREYEPDFLADIGETADGKPRLLVIEMKGREDDAARAKAHAAERWCEALTAVQDPAAPGEWKYLSVQSADELSAELHRRTSP